ncbi:MAG: flavodoxin [Lactobacillus sp.]
MEQGRDAWQKWQGFSGLLFTDARRLLGRLKSWQHCPRGPIIKAKTGGDSYEIVPAKPYPNSYNATTRVAQREQDSNARPAIKNALPNVKKYSTVFIGSPIWWGEYPMIVRTFIDNERLNGKTVIPFTTSEGSGLGNTAATLRRAYPKARVRGGFSAEGNDVKNDPQAVQRQVNAWLNRLGY